MILPDDLVMVRVQSRVARGEIAVALIDDEATLKRVYEEAGGLVLKGDNPDFTPCAFPRPRPPTCRSWARWWACTATWRAKDADEALEPLSGAPATGPGVLLWGDTCEPWPQPPPPGGGPGAPVLVVGAANRFDPYQLVREAGTRKLSPQEALTRVRVARAFTSHQLVRLLTETFPAILEQGSLVLVLGPVSLFYDEQVPLGERRRLFQDLVRLLARIKTGSALLLLQPPCPGPPPTNTSAGSWPR